MRYRVVITHPADRNFQDLFQWISERSPEGANAWRTWIIEAVKSLEISPERHPLARESAALQVEIRCLLSGKNRPAFHILHQIKGGEVRILAIRRPSQDFMEPGNESESAP